MRTLVGADVLASQWKYIPVRAGRRFFIEESRWRGLKWVVFEPNGAILWQQIRLNVNAFLQVMFVAGAFAGAAPARPYSVRCRSSDHVAERHRSGYRQYPGWASRR